MNPQDAPLQQVLTLPGAVALSPFRVEKLLASLPRALAETVSVDTRFVHFAAVSAPLRVGARPSNAVTSSNDRRRVIFLPPFRRQIRARSLLTTECCGAPGKPPA